MNPSRYAFLFIAVVLLLSPVYADEDDHDHEHEETETVMTTSAKWGFGIGASLIISSLGFLCSAVMLLILKSKKLSSSALKYLILVLVAFAIGALLGDVVVHILPECFGGHSHGAEEESHDEHEHEEEEEESTPKTAISSLLVLVGFGFFVVLEKVFEWSGIVHSHGPMDDGHCHGHGHKEETHSHAHEKPSTPLSKLHPENPEIQPIKQVSEGVVSEEPETPQKEGDIEGQQQMVKVVAEEAKEKRKPSNSSQETLDLNENRSSSCYKTLFSLKNRKSTGIMVLFADLIHNVMDGIAIGVAFASGDKNLAVSTFIAVLAHEIPQEISDVGILLDSKFPVMQALCCTGIFQFSALIGAFIGLGVGNISEAVNAYILAFVAGNFLYISLVNMVPIIMKESRPKHSAGLLAAFIVGAGIMFAILKAEEDEH